MPQEEEEETVSEVEEASLLTGGERSAITVSKRKKNAVFLCVIMLFLCSSLWDCQSVASLQSKSSSMLWFGVI